MGEIGVITKDHIEDLATLLAQEQGKPMADALFEIAACASIFEYQANAPFGGARQSGLGSELGTQGLLAFTQLKLLA